MKVELSTGKTNRRATPNGEVVSFDEDKEFAEEAEKAKREFFENSRGINISNFIKVGLDKKMDLARG